MAFLGLFVLKLPSQLDPVFAFIALGVMAFWGLRLLGYSLANPLIPYLMMQFITFFIFFETKFLAPFLGGSVKIYALFFGLCLLSSLYYLVKHFGYLWKQYVFFRYIFLFSLVTLIYILIGHNSDFRTNLDYLSLQYSLAQAGGGSTNSQNFREFGDFAAYVQYLEVLVPVVSCTLGLMLFRPLPTQNNQELLKTVINVTSVILLVYYLLSALAVALGTSPSFNSLSGITGNENGALATLFPLIIVGFRYLAHHLPLLAISKHTKILLDVDFIFSLLTLFFFIDQSGSSTSIGGTALGLAVLMGVTWLKQLDLPFFKYAPVSQQAEASRLRKPLGTTAKQGSSLMLVLVGMLTIGVFVIMGEAETGFHSMSLRLSHWSNVIDLFTEHLSFLTILFGNGLGQVNEDVYYSSFSHPVEKGIQSPHNYYLAVFYDYGLLCSLILVPFVLIVTQSVTVFFKSCNKKDLLVYAILFSSILAIGVEKLFLDLTQPSKMVFFAWFSFLLALASFPFEPPAPERSQLKL
jgi:hypothetical protein